MVIFTCPECGHDLLSEVLTCYPPIHKDYCPNCGWSYSNQEQVIRVPFSVNSLNMRNATSEEQKNIQEAIEKIAQPTPINFWNYYKEHSPCDGCSNNPKNGGSGNCCCTLGQEVLYV